MWGPLTRSGTRGAQLPQGIASPRGVGICGRAPPELTGLKSWAGTASSRHPKSPTAKEQLGSWPRRDGGPVSTPHPGHGLSPDSPPPQRSSQSGPRGPRLPHHPHPSRLLPSAQTHWSFLGPGRSLQLRLLPSLWPAGGRSCWPWGSALVSPPPRSPPGPAKAPPQGLPPRGGCSWVFLPHEWELEAGGAVCLPRMGSPHCTPRASPETQGTHAEGPRLK